VRIKRWLKGMKLEKRMARSLIIWIITIAISITLAEHFRNTLGIMAVFLSTVVGGAIFVVYNFSTRDE